MKPISLLIVDDQKIMRDQLTGLIEQHPNFEITASATNGKEALEMIECKKIDAMFLDVEMPEMSGLELANVLSVEKHAPKIVFATAYSNHAVAAFEANAVDYILKPYRADRIAKALEKISKALAQPADDSNMLGLGKSLFEKGLVKKLIAHKKNSKNRMIIDPATCDYFHAKFAEVFVRNEGQDYVVNMTLKELSQSLSAHKFELCHKAYLVNLEKVEKITPMLNHTFEISLKSGEKIPLSRNFARTILEKVVS